MKSNESNRHEVLDELRPLLASRGVVEQDCVGRRAVGQHQPSAIGRPIQGCDPERNGGDLSQVMAIDDARDEAMRSVARNRKDPLTCPVQQDWILIQRWRKHSLLAPVNERDSKQTFAFTHREEIFAVRMERDGGASSQRSSIGIKGEKFHPMIEMHAEPGLAGNEKELLRGTGVGMRPGMHDLAGRGVEDCKAILSSGSVLREVFGKGFDASHSDMRCRPLVSPAQVRKRQRG